MIKISVCLTVKNENIDEILKQIISQSILPFEIVIVDASKNNWFSDKKRKAYARYNIKYVKKAGNRSCGRNLAVDKASSENILLLDAGCELDTDLIRNIALSLQKQKSEIIAGSYTSRVFNFQKYIFSKFLNRNINSKNFYPSARNFGIKKPIFKALGGFDEKLDTAEDLEFFKRALDQNFKIVKCVKALVYWDLPNLKEYINKIYNYARGDARSRIFWDQRKKLGTHNIKHILTISRWLVIVVLFVTSHFYVAAFLLSVYFLSIAIKHRINFNKYNHGVIFFDIINLAEFIFIKIVTDFSVMSGFIVGIV